MHRRYHALAGIAFLVVLAVVGVGFVPLAEAGHGTDANYTVHPVEAPEDRAPGSSDASYQQFAEANESIEKIDYFVVTWEAGDLSGCGASDTEELGIDRGGNNSGTETDEGLLQYVKDQQRGEDRVVVEFYDDDDAVGETTYINESDQIVSYQTDCFGNPDEPGWYQITAMLNGTGWDGEDKEVSATSHYFWICDCESEEEAREELGPPPSEAEGDDDGQQEGAETQTATAEDDDGQQEGAETQTATAEDDDSQQEGAETQTATAEDDDGGDEGDAEDDDIAEESPATDDQPGLGALTAILALAGASGILLLRQRQ